MDIGEPLRKVNVVPLKNPVPETAPSNPTREPVEEPSAPEKLPA